MQKKQICDRFRSFAVHAVPLRTYRSGHSRIAQKNIIYSNGDSALKLYKAAVEQTRRSFLKQIAIVSRHPLLTDYTNMLSLLHCSFLIIRDAGGLSTLCDGLLLPGKGDCSPALYGKKNNGSRSLCLEEDLLQLSAFEQYMQAKRPILGIDKGMHLINIGLGGSIRQNIGDYPHSRIDWPCEICNYFDRYHTTSLPEGSLLEALYGPCICVNSAHHQAIDQLGRELDIIQYAPDGCPEAILHRSLPIIGVQWHPERMCFEAGQFPGFADGSLLFRLYLALI